MIVLDSKIVSKSGCYGVDRSVSALEGGGFKGCTPSAHSAGPHCQTHTGYEQSSPIGPQPKRCTYSPWCSFVISSMRYTLTQTYPPTQLSLFRAGSTHTPTHTWFLFWVVLRMCPALLVLTHPLKVRGSSRYLDCLHTNPAPLLHHLLQLLA